MPMVIVAARKTGIFLARSRKMRLRYSLPLEVKRATTARKAPPSMKFMAMMWRVKVTSSSVLKSQ